MHRSGFTLNNISVILSKAKNLVETRRGFFTNVQNDQNDRSAFTLAEVLLTLAIIGVVAALTIPAVITKVTQDQYVVGLKKAYNTLKAVQREAEQEHGPMENWNWALDSKDSFEKYFKPHFDILKDCSTTTDTACFQRMNEIKYLNGDGCSYDYNSASRYRFITSDGIAYSYTVYPANVYPVRMGIFITDINGKKGPNIFGRDIFQFNVFRKAGIKSFGSLLYDDETQTMPSSDVDNNCNNSSPGNGNCCATKVLSEGAMNY